MYDDLIQRLHRYTENCVAYKLDADFASAVQEAADAIEELGKQLDEETEYATALSCYVPQWIPVTERLPGSGVHVLACCRVKWLNGNGRSYVCDAFYSAPKTEVCSYNDEIDAEYDEETDEYYIPEGWWEVIKNWDDYSCVAIADFVTHWMPLPEPPKEKT